jgi:hypothetical protein
VDDQNMAHFSPLQPESDIGYLEPIKDLGSVDPRSPVRAAQPTLGEAMGVRSTTVTASLALLLCATLASCTAEEAPEPEVDSALLELERAADALSVTILRPGAERAFARKGHPVGAPLNCTAVAPADPSADPSQEREELAEGDGDAATPEGTGDAGEARGGRLEVVCTGESRQGQQLHFEGRLLLEALAGRDEGDDSLRGEFTGLAGGDEVFAMDCFQCSPAGSEPAGKGSGAGEDSASEDGSSEGDEASPETE